MKKILPTFMVICLFTVGTFAGWIHTTNKIACNPQSSEPGTCIWVDDDPVNRAAALPDETISVLKSVRTFIFVHNPFDYFF